MTPERLSGGAKHRKNEGGAGFFWAGFAEITLFFVIFVK